MLRTANTFRAILVYQQLYRQTRTPGDFAGTHQDMSGLPVNLCHLLYLMVSFVDVALVDTNSVNLKPVLYFQVTCEFQETQEIPSDLQPLAIDVDERTFVRVAPHIRETYIVVSLGRHRLEYAREGIRKPAIVVDLDHTYHGPTTNQVACG